MPKKIEIDSEKLKALHAQGLSDEKIGEKLGCSGVTIGVKRRVLGLPGGRPGRKPSGKTSEPGGGAARRSPRAAANPPVVSGTATIHLSAAGLDRLWAALSLETKAELIEGIAD